MASKSIEDNSGESIVTVDEVKRVLEVGRLLLAVLTQEELDQLQQFMSGQVIDCQSIESSSSEYDSELGNTSVT